MDRSLGGCFSTHTAYTPFCSYTVRHTQYDRHCSRSSKVDDFGTNRKRICDFLLVINSNHGHILHHFWDTATYWLKIAYFPTPEMVWVVNFGSLCTNNRNKDIKRAIACRNNFVQKTLLTADRVTSMYICAHCYHVALNGPCCSSTKTTAAHLPWCDWISYKQISKL